MIITGKARPKRMPILAVAEILPEVVLQFESFV